MQTRLSRKTKCENEIDSRWIKKGEGNEKKHPDKTENIEVKNT